MVKDGIVDESIIHSKQVKRSLDEESKDIPDDIDDSENKTDDID